MKCMQSPEHVGKICRSQSLLSFKLGRKMVDTFYFPHRTLHMVVTKMFSQMMYSLTYIIYNSIEFLRGGKFLAESFSSRLNRFILRDINIQ